MSNQIRKEVNMVVEMNDGQQKLSKVSGLEVSVELRH